MSGEVKGKRIAGARNPKTVKIQVHLAGHINELIEQVADMLGQNKGATASMALAIGLRELAGRTYPWVGELDYVDEKGRYHHKVLLTKVEADRDRDEDEEDLLRQRLDGSARVDRQ